MAPLEHLMVKYYSIVYIQFIMFLCSFNDGYLSHAHLLVTMNICLKFWCVHGGLQEEETVKISWVNF